MRIKPIEPAGHGERVALFRVQILGPVLNRNLLRGELKAELAVIAQRKFRPPGSDCTRTYSVCTLMRWRRRYERLGLSGLIPQSRRVGDALDLSPEQRAMVLDIRREKPSVTATLVIRTLEGDGRLAEGQLKEQTLQRLYRNHNLPRIARKNIAAHSPSGERRRWEAESVGELWHADVCHGVAIRENGKTVKVRIHAILDDKSRYIVALRVLGHEREVAMLTMTTEAIGHFGAPRTLYLDNGSTYRGAALSTACARLNIQLLHAQPYDPQARGKMERFWRTLREGCLDHIGEQPSLHAIQIRLLAFVHEYYHKAAHSSLMGKSPAQVWKERQLRVPSEDELRAALTVRETRIVRNDCTVSVGNVDWEVRESYLAKRRITICRTLYAPSDKPWVEHDEETYELYLVDPVANGKLRKKRKEKPGVDAVDFEPAEVLRDTMLHKPKRHGGGTNVQS